MFLRFFSTSKKLLHGQQFGVSKDGVVKLESLTNKSMEGALKVMREAFLPTESLCKAVRLLDEPGAAEELLNACYDVAKDGISIVATDTSTNEVVGVLFNKIRVLEDAGDSYYDKLKKNCKHKSLEAFYEFTIHLESKVDLFKRYNTNCFIEQMYIATLPDLNRRNIAGMLGMSAYKLGKQLNNGENVKTPFIEGGEISHAEAIPSILAALTTSNYSQKIAHKLGYDTVLEVKYDDYTFDGKTFSERIGDVHKTCRVVVKRLDV